MKVVLKRVYDKPADTDGYRVLVDRLWPRGIKKEDLHYDEWCKDIAPSAELRTWFHSDPEARFGEFSARYISELERSSAAAELLKRAEGKGKLTLLYAARDLEHNHAKTLQTYLSNLS